MKQQAILFAEYCVKRNYTYYYNGKEYLWANSRKQEYYSSEELYDKFIEETNEKK
jgi:hypothetical protein